MQLTPTNQKLNVTHVDFETFAELIRSESTKGKHQHLGL